MAGYWSTGSCSAADGKPYAQRQHHGCDEAVQKARDEQHSTRQLRTGTDLAASRHFVSWSADFAPAIRLGLGWGLLPEQECGADLIQPAPPARNLTPVSGHAWPGDLWTVKPA